jgi:hypothetical protein
MMSDALQSHLDGPGAHRQAFAERMVAHRLNAVREAASAAGFTNFEIARAILHYGIEEMMFVGRDPELVDAAIEEATAVAQVVASDSG